MAAVLVHIDLDAERPHPASLVALAAGRDVASSWGATLYAAVIVHDSGERSPADSLAAANVPGIAAIESALARAGADKVVVATTDAPISPLWETVGGAWQRVISQLRPRLVLFGADAPSAPELGPRTGARIGARLLARARAIGIDDVELRDRDGGYARIGDTGAVVAMIGGRAGALAGDDDVDLVAIPDPDDAPWRIELGGSRAADIVHVGGVVIAIGDDVAGDPHIVASARRLADALGGQLVGNRGGRAIVPAGSIVERATPLAPDLCVTLGAAQLDLAGSTSLVRIGVGAGRTADGALPGPVGPALDALLDALEAL